MGNIFSDITEDIELKPTKSKKVIKWVIRIAVLLICGAFILGQIKIKSLNKVGNFEKTLQENTQAVKDLKQETENGFKAVNGRIDKVYDDGLKEFNSFQDFNKKQLIMVIDYGQTNKNLLKQMLELNSIEKSKAVESNLEQAKTQKDTFNIVVKPMPKK
jgi:hypothetical protein